MHIEHCMRHEKMCQQKYSLKRQAKSSTVQKTISRLKMTPDLLQIALESNGAGLIVMQGKVKRERPGGPGAGDVRL